RSRKFFGRKERPSRITPDRKGLTPSMRRRITDGVGHRVRARIQGGPAGRGRGQRDEPPPVRPPAESFWGAVTGFDRWPRPVTDTLIDASLWRGESCYLKRRARGPPPRSRPLFLPRRKGAHNAGRDPPQPPEPIHAPRPSGPESGHLV